MVKGILINRKADDALKSQARMEHADLVAEMQTVENLPTHERLQLARLRRTQQLKMARQKDKEWQKLQRAKGNAPTANSGNTTHYFRSNSSNEMGRRHISFENSVVLLEAASRNDMQEVAELLDHGITPDAANEDGLTALHQCCIDNNFEMLGLLLDFGANVDAQDSDKWTPLHAAATCGHLELVRILIEHGANLLAVNTDGNMPYDLCDDENTLDFIEAEMSKRGVTQELIDETRSSTERKMLRDLMEIAASGGDLEQADYQGATPLHIAAANGYVRVVEFLLELHVNVDALDKDMWSPVHAAACWGHLEVLEMLAQCGADLNVSNKDNETPSDICEDPEIRERIEQLKTEQESKRLAEAQRRRVRRSQSNNTRAQSVRRTSLRDKTLTTKKDAVEETRLRLQAQDVFIKTDCTKLDPNGIQSSSSKHSGASALSFTSNNNNNNNTIRTNYDNDKELSQASLALHNGIYLSHSKCADEFDATPSNMEPHMQASRRPPDGRENDDHALLIYDDSQQPVSSAAVSLSEGHRAGVSTTETTETSVSTNVLQTQSSKEANNGKINVQVTVLVDTTNHKHHQSVAQSQQHSNDASDSSASALSGFVGATLANLKKQRSLSRTNVLNNYENGSVLGTANTNHNNNSISCDGVTTPVSNQPLNSDQTPSQLGYSNIFKSGEATSSHLDDVNSASVNKFCGITGDVVSDSTSSKKCCKIM